ncbi:MAG: TetR/AcrR family transcriptional regulator [Firmicutes bacterium]|nr:TetR/AcrR family transcriptional regulator [Bacillota bacterium]
MNLDAKRREAIINAALREFARRGYDHASTNVMAREAGLSKPLFFHYVKSKKDLFLFLCDYSLEVVKTMTEELLKPVKAERDIFKRLRLMIEARVRVFRKIPDLYRFFVAAFLTDAEPVRNEMRSRLAKYHAMGINQVFCADTDESKFKESIDIEKALKIIEWTSEGFAYEILNDLNTKQGLSFDYEWYSQEFERYLALLEKIFYK